VDFVDAVDRHGAESDLSWQYAANVLVAGRLLGSWLDQSILYNGGGGK
jgi:hypothetical protein